MTGLSTIWLSFHSYTHYLFLQNFSRPQLCRQQNCSFHEEIMCKITLKHYLHPIISGCAVAFRELNSKKKKKNNKKNYFSCFLKFFNYEFVILTRLSMFRPAHQAGWSRFVRPCLLCGAQHDSPCGEFCHNSLPSFSFHFLSPARCPGEIPSRNLIKVSSLFIEDLSILLFFLSFFQIVLID